METFLEILKRFETARKLTTGGFAMSDLRCEELYFKFCTELVANPDWVIPLTEKQPALSGKRPIDDAVRYMWAFIAGKNTLADAILAMNSVFRPQPDRQLRATKTAMPRLSGSVVPVFIGGAVQFVNIYDDKIVACSGCVDIKTEHLSACVDFCVNTRGAIVMQFAKPGLYLQKIGGEPVQICDVSQITIVVVTSQHVYFTQHDIMYSVNLETLERKVVFLYEMYEEYNGVKIYFESVRGGTWISSDRTAVTKYKIVGKSFPFINGIAYFDDGSNIAKISLESLLVAPDCPTQ